MVQRNSVNTNNGLSNKLLGGTRFHARVKLFCGALLKTLRNLFYLSYIYVQISTSVWATNETEKESLFVSHIRVVITSNLSNHMTDYLPVSLMLPVTLF